VIAPAAAAAGGALQLDVLVMMMLLAGAAAAETTATAPGSGSTQMENTAPDLPFIKTHGSWGSGSGSTTQKCPSSAILLVFKCTYFFLEPKP